MLVVDVSKSFSDGEAKQLKQFALQFVLDSPSICETATNIGMIRFSSAEKTRVDIGLSEYVDKDALVDAINSFMFEFDRGNSSHHLDAMTKAIQQIDSGRPNARDIIVFVTDRLPNPPSQSAIAISKDARSNKNITIFAILIRPTPARIEEMRQISGNDTFFTIDAAADLSNIIADFTRTDCEGKYSLVC